MILDSLFIAVSETPTNQESSRLGKPLVAGVSSARLKKTRKANTARPCKFDAAAHSPVSSPKSVENAVKNQLPPTGRAAKLSRPKTPSPATHRPSEEQSSQAGTQRFLVKNNFVKK